MTTTGPKLSQTAYSHYQEKGFSRAEVDTYFPIVMAIIEKRVADARLLLRAVSQSEGQEGVQRAELFKKAFIAHQKMLKEEIDAAEEQKRQYEQNQKQKADLEEEFRLLSIQEKSIRDAIINRAALEIAKSLKTCVFPSGKNHFEGKSLEQIAAFVKDLILTERALKQKLEAERKTETKLLEDIQELERIGQHIISKIEAEQSQTASSAATQATYNTLIRAPQSSTPAVTKSCLPKNLTITIAQPKMTPAYSSASAAAATSSSRAEYPAPNHMMASEADVAAKSSNMHTQAQRASSALVSTAAFTTPAVVIAASSNNTALPPRQSAAPKLQIPPPSSNPFKPKASAVQTRIATSSVLPSTLTASTANFNGASNQSKKYPARVYEYYRPKGYSDNEVDTFLSILQYIGEGKVTEAKQLASNLDDSNRAKLARFREDQRTYQELQEKQIAEMAKLENKLHKISLEQREIKDALRETQARKAALINKAALEIAANIKDYASPTGKKYFEGKSLEQIASFIKDLIISERELNACIQSVNESKANSQDNIQKLERLKGAILERLQAEQSQSASSAGAASSNPVFSPSQPSAPAVAKSSAPKNPSLAQPKLKPMSSAASAAAAAAGNSSMAASSVKPTNTALQTQRTSSAAVSTAAFTTPAVVTAASSNNAALPPRQSATPKLQTSPLPSANPLKHRAPAAQVRARAAAASSIPTNAATQLDMEPSPPAYLVQAKASAKPAISKPNSKQAPMTAPRPLPPTPCHAMTARASAISAPGPARNGTRPSK